MTKAKKPNILVIFGDDVGWFNLSCYNHGLMGYRTPNIDRIAREGAMFTDAYGQQSCTAGRSAFLTGQNPLRTGLTKVGMPNDKLGLQFEDPTLAELLAPQGYASAQFGKNHLGDRDEHLPTVHGFEEFFGFLYHLNAMEEPFNPDYPKDDAFKAKYGPRPLLHCKATTLSKDAPEGDHTPLRGRAQTIEDLGDLPPERMKHLDDDIVGRALEWMTAKSRGDAPWFCWVNTARMHVWTHLKEDAVGVTGLGVYPDAMVEHDRHVGRLLDKLAELGVEEDTIVVYTTDNGAELFSWPDGGTTVFHGEKNTSWEGGYRIPLVMRYPGVIERGQVVNDVISLEDFVPTLMAWAGEPDIKEKLAKGHRIGHTTYRAQLDGYNLAEHLDTMGARAQTKDLVPWPRREFIYVTDTNEIAALRHGNWKALMLEQRAHGFAVWDEPFVPLRAPKLFNLRSDPLERALHEAGDYDHWRFDRLFLALPIKDFLMEFYKTFLPEQVQEKKERFHRVRLLLEKLIDNLHGAATLNR